MNNYYLFVHDNGYYTLLFICITYSFYIKNSLYNCIFVSLLRAAVTCICTLIAHLQSLWLLKVDIKALISN